MSAVPADAKILTAVLENARVLGSGLALEELFSTIIRRLQTAFNSEGGTLYIYDPTSETLKTVLISNDVLGISQVVETFDPLRAKGFIEMPVRDDAGEINLKAISVCCFFENKQIMVPDLKAPTRYDFSRTFAFDEKHGYSTRNLVVLPLQGSDNEVIGVLQMVNSDDTVFDPAMQKYIAALSGQISAALHNALLMTEAKNLLSAFIEMISAAIDEKSPHTAGHCMRVTELTMMIAEEMSAATDGVYKDFSLDDEQMRELRIAAMMHDVGKIITPVHVMEKPTKLYGLSDRFALVRDRLHHWQLAQKMQRLEAAVRAAGREDLLAAAEAGAADAADRDIKADLEFLDQVNHCLVFVDEPTEERLSEIAKRPLNGTNGTSGDGANGCDAADSEDDDTKHDLPAHILDKEMLGNLKLRRGTLNPAERKIMEEHVSISKRLLSSIPWPKNLANVVEYAAHHHEWMNGKGYPAGITGDQMSLPARVLGLSDRFEAISAFDRPYRTKKNTLKDVMKIMGFMSKDEEIDADLYQFFVDKKIYLKYAQRFLPAELIDCD